MPTRTCLHPTCPNPATQRGRCRTHARTNDSTINRAGTHIYNTKRWRITRDHHLFQHPLCQCEDPNCHEIATDVHHRVDLADGGDPWAQTNLQALAHACHSRLTREGQTHVV